ncbi:MULTISPECIES: redoxin domain-containing protein [unclassified Salinibacterium]|uniref:redoxin domain-containing protein n=1 Tax=unclassified Salinibacterium TaxID=2632331 RepID=UPI0018CF25F5|nr:MULTISPECIES: redoxin domain-containing protein [unclassified Salinibacterium]MBH0054056.1 redoxin domain-containing protein [Salinibacterium sp. SWN139]MBH0083342.1 redoxin domain-containing protein [Salinibacterium sp. SWN167]
MTITRGAVAPDFELRNQHGQTVSLQELLSRRAVLVVFIPLAFSPVCAAEVAQLNDWHDIAASAGVEVVVISVDSVATLRAWSDDTGFRLSLLSDFWPHGAVAKQFEVFLEDKGFARRASFLIDHNGVVQSVIESALGEPRAFSDYEHAIVALTSAADS